MWLKVKVKEKNNILWLQRNQKKKNFKLIFHILYNKFI